MGGRGEGVVSLLMQMSAFWDAIDAFNDTSVAIFSLMKVDSRRLLNLCWLEFSRCGNAGGGSFAYQCGQSSDNPVTIQWRSSDDPLTIQWQLFASPDRAVATGDGDAIYWRVSAAAKPFIKWWDMKWYEMIWNDIKSCWWRRMRRYGNVVGGWAGRGERGGEISRNEINGGIGGIDWWISVKSGLNRGHCRYSPDLNNR